tara:strand:- start:319 stop:552 length:234 start_codon:yes stop_codon:yes gene_type:complete
MIKYKLKAKDKEIEYLQRTIKWFKTQIEPHDCGWIHTTIDGLKHRIKVLKKNIKKDLPKESWVEGYNKWKEEHESNK